MIVDGDGERRNCFVIKATSWSPFPSEVFLCFVSSLPPFYRERSFVEVSARLI